MIDTGEPGMSGPTNTSVIINGDSSSGNSSGREKLERGVDTVDTMMGKTMKLVVDICQMISIENIVSKNPAPKSSVL